MKINWQIKKIGECLENIPKLGSLLSSEYLNEGKFPVIDQGQDFIAGYTNDNSLVFDDCLPVVIFGDHTRALKFVDFPFAVGADGTKILKPINDFDSRFFYYILFSLDLRSRGYARHFKLLKEQEIPLPPLSEQKRIVKILDEKMEKIREVKRLREEGIKDTEKIFSRTLHEIFEEGKKKGWEIKGLQFLCDKPKQDIVDGPFGSDLKRSDYTSFGIPVLKIQNVKEFKIKIKNLDYVTEIKALELKRHTYKKGDIVMTKLGEPLGISAIVDGIEDGVIVADLIRIRAQKIDTRYLCYFLNSPETKIYINSKQKGTTRKRIKLSVVRDLPIIFPDNKKEQEKIVKKLDELSEKLRTLRDLQTSQLVDLKLLEKSYLREAFNGELV